MLEFLAGLGAGTVAWTALSMVLASRKDRKAREDRQRFAEMQRQILAVQDYVAFCSLNRADSESAQSRRMDMWRLKVQVRDHAAAAFLEG